MDDTCTPQEWNDLLTKYAEVQMRFTSYYKFSFYFAGVTPAGAQVYATVGGTGDDIYRLEVRATMPFSELSPRHVSVNAPDGTLELTKHNPHDW